MNEELKQLLPSRISPRQAKDTGMAMVLICLLLATFSKPFPWLGIAIALLLLDMLWPVCYKPVATIWLGLSHLLGTVMSKVILSILFFALVTPIGVARRITGADSMKIKQWKQGTASVFRQRNHTFSAADIEKPF